jgi:anti-sigma B factor antagonist
MTSSFQPSSGKLQINLTGDLIGGADAMKFSVDLRESLAATSYNRVDIDAGAVGFVNSSGLGMLIAARQAAQEHGAEFRLNAPGEQLKHLLEVTKLTEILGAA